MRYLHPALGSPQICHFGKDEIVHVPALPINLLVGFPALQSFARTLTEDATGATVALYAEGALLIPTPNLEADNLPDSTIGMRPCQYRSLDRVK